MSIHIRSWGTENRAVLLKCYCKVYSNSVAYGVNNKQPKVDSIKGASVYKTFPRLTNCVMKKRERGG